MPFYLSGIAGARFARVTLALPCKQGRGLYAAQLKFDARLAFAGMTDMSYAVTKI